MNISLSIITKTVHSREPKQRKHHRHCQREWNKQKTLTAIIQSIYSLARSILAAKVTKSQPGVLPFWHKWQPVTMMSRTRLLVSKDKYWNSASKYGLQYKYWNSASKYRLQYKCRVALTLKVDRRPTCIRFRGFWEAFSRLRFWCIWSCTMSEKHTLAALPPGGLAGAKRCHGLSGGLEAGGGSGGVAGIAWGWDGMRIGRPQLWQNQTDHGTGLHVVDTYCPQLCLMERLLQPDCVTFCCWFFSDSVIWLHAVDTLMEWLMRLDCVIFFWLCELIVHCGHIDGMTTVAWLCDLIVCCGHIDATTTVAWLCDLIGCCGHTDGTTTLAWLCDLITCCGHILSADVFGWKDCCGQTGLNADAVWSCYVRIDHCTMLYKLCNWICAKQVFNMIKTKTWLIALALEQRS